MEKEDRRKSPEPDGIRTHNLLITRFSSAVVQLLIGNLIFHWKREGELGFESKKRVLSDERQFLFFLQKFQRHDEPNPEIRLRGHVQQVRAHFRYSSTTLWQQSMKKVDCLRYIYFFYTTFNIYMKIGNVCNSSNGNIR